MSILRRLRWPRSARHAKGHAIVLAVILWIMAAVVGFTGTSDRGIAGPLKGADFVQYYTLGHLASSHRIAPMYDAALLHEAQVDLIPGIAARNLPSGLPAPNRRHVCSGERAVIPARVAHLVPADDCRVRADRVERLEACRASAAGSDTLHRCGGGLPTVLESRAPWSGDGDPARGILGRLACAREAAPLARRPRVRAPRDQAAVRHSARGRGPRVRRVGDARRRPLLGGGAGGGGLVDARLGGVHGVCREHPDHDRLRGLPGSQALHEPLAAGADAARAELDRSADVGASSRRSCCGTRCARGRAAHRCACASESSCWHRLSSIRT